MKARALGVATVVAANATWGRRRAQPPAAGRFADVHDRRIHYVEREGEGPPLLLLHGMPGTHLDYERLLPLLEGRRAIAIDRPGYGWSQGGPLPYQQQIDLVPALLATLGADRAVLVGHSFGGLLALGVAARHPDVVAGLALLAPSGGGLRSGPFRRAAAHLVRAMQHPGVRELSELTVGGLIRRGSARIDSRFAFAPDPVDATYAKRLNAVTLQDGNLAAMAADRLAYDANSAWIDERLADIEAPSVTLLAREDRPIPIRHGRQLAAGLRANQLLEVPGGHMLPIVRPRAVADAIALLQTRVPLAG
jgi:pimeloyl-ACP methyl ester carboxylesterase